MSKTKDKHSFIETFLHNAGKYPEHSALYDDLHPKGIDNQTLLFLSSKVYRWLKEKGLGKEDFVLINLPRGAMPVIAIIGVWRAGCAFTLVEEGYASERIDYIRKDCGCKAEINEHTWTRIMLCRPLEGYEKVDLHDAAYAVYTSGTTGNPKGVLHEFGNVMQTVDAHRIDGKSFIDAGERIALIAPLNFVASVMIIILSLYYKKTVLYIVPYRIVKNPGLLLKFFDEKRISLTFLSPSYIRRLPGKISPHMKKMIVGSEPASQIWMENIDIYNCYAMSESGFPLSVFEIDKAYDTCPIGKPRFDIDIKLIDDSGQEVPEGESGEICFTNPYVRGYINLSEETAEHFRGGWFHTGDIGKRDTNENLVLMGRSGDMIKINGNRIEPLEIEAAIKQILGIDWAAVRGFEEDGRSYLCAYYTADITVDSEKMREELLKRLPYYMLPTYYIRIDEIPLNSNGKFNRRALPKPDITDYVKVYKAPENDIQEKLCTAFAKVLNLERVGIYDDFYELGGDSLAAIELVVVCVLPGLNASEIFRGRTPEGIAELYEKLRAVDDANPDKTNDEAMKEAHPLTAEQLYMVDYQLRSPKSTMYNLFTLLKFDINFVDMENMAKAVEKAIRNHPALLTTYFFNEDGELMQRYTPEVLNHIFVEHMTEWEFHNTIKDNLVQPFKIADTKVPQRLSRCRVFQTEKSGYVFFDVHHSVMDGSSFKVFLGNISLYYRGENPKKDYYYLMLKQREGAHLTDFYEESRKYFNDRYGNYMWQTYPNPDYENTQSEELGELIARIDVDIHKLETAEKSYQISRNGFFITVAALAISIYNNYPDILLAWNYNAREDTRMMTTVGLLFRELPVAFRFEDSMTLREIFAMTKDQVEKGIKYNIYPYVDLMTHGTQMDAAYLLYQQDMRDMTGFDDDIKPETVDVRQNQAATQTVLDMEILDGSEGLELLIDYAASRYKEESMVSFKNLFLEISRFITELSLNENVTFGDIKGIINRK
ncbi:MAG: AMP-binding protein [Lachnospiraceae bacterium]|nr:AMP-binding protein [Lachnospiraceae bacterium]